MTTTDPHKRHDVELRCDMCQREKLATAGCYTPRCYCGGTLRVTVAHDHVLTQAEAAARGYGFQPMPAERKL